MRIYLERDRLVYCGSARELRAFLKSLPAGKLTLRQYITGLLH